MSQPQPRDLLHTQEIKALVRDTYHAVASPAGAVARKLYSAEELAQVPPIAIDGALGVASPPRHAGIELGDTVLDLGCGSGIDTILAARRTGPTGRVIALDFLPAMLDRTATAARQAGLRNVETLHADIEDIPLPDRSVDQIISNGVLNLCPRKARALARKLGAPKAEVRALTVLGIDLACLNHSEEGVAYVRRALQLAEEIGDHLGLERAYVNLTDLLTKLGRLRESARLGQAGLEMVHQYGIYSALLVSNQIETLLAIGDWDEAERLSAAALRGITSSFPYWLLTIRAQVEIGRGELDAARAHLQAARATPREDRVFGLFDACLAELALWEHRWTDADAAIQDGLAQARQREAAQIRVWFCAKGLRAQAELAALARARRDAGAVRNWLTQARKLITIARCAAAEAPGVTPSARGWLTLAEAEHERARGPAPPGSWSQAADTWQQLERPPLVAYCRWRQAEALVAAGASRTEAAIPLREAHAVAARIGAKPLLREIELLAQRARLDLAPPQAAFPTGRDGPEEILGLTPREAQVLDLLARGYTNREIAADLVISVKTAGVHVSHILRKPGRPTGSRRLRSPTASPRHAGPPEREA
jgi:DNA-binding CsgD family transcriptional regulator/SAM-dependent methyltransferase